MIPALIFIFIALNAATCLIYYRRELGVFQAPFIICLISIFVMLPQLTSIYYDDQYDRDIIPTLCYVMISCNLAFTAAFELARSTKNSNAPLTINFRKAQLFVVLLALAGFATIFIYRVDEYKKVVGSETIDSVAAANLKIFAVASLALALTAFCQGARSRLLYIAAGASAATLANYAFFVKGSRMDTLVLLIYGAIFLSIKFPQKRTTIKRLFTTLIIAGCVFSASISGIRNVVRGGEFNQGTSLTQLNYWDSFVSSFTLKRTGYGADLGNAALGIDYCLTNNSYDYGSYLWNLFVIGYVPKRFFGEDFKNSLLIDAGSQSIAASLTSGVTTMTGYFDAFSAFSFFGFILFGVFGYFFGFLWKRGGLSSFHLAIYFFLLTMTPFMITHGINAIMFYIYLGSFFIFPIIFMFSRREKHWRQKQKGPTQGGAKIANGFQSI